MHGNNLTVPDASAQKQQWAQNNNEKIHHAQNGFKKKGFPQRTKDVVGSFAWKLHFKGSVFDAPSTSHAYKKNNCMN